jgi:predicted phage terminase large subunit-like protein
MTLLEYFETQRPKTYRTEWSTRWICLALQRAYDERKNLIIECMPRGGKSEPANVYAPAWWLRTHPDDNIGLICSEDGLASKFVSATRNLLARNGAAFEFERSNEFKLKGTRSLDATYTGRGVHSNLSGRGFSALHADDCLKSGTEAMSDLVRERLWTDVISAGINRLTPDGIVIAMQARLHSQDIIGKLLDTGLKFLRLHLPATNDSGDRAYFEDGYSGEKRLFPPYKAMTSRYPRAKLDEIFSTVTSYYWMAQYAQTPSLGDMAYFKIDNLPRYDHPSVRSVWIAIDAANTATKSGSYSVAVALGFDGKSQLQVIDCIRGRWRQDELQAEVLAFYASVTRRVGLRPEAVIVERAAAGYGLIDMLGSQLPIVPLVPKGSKEERAAAVAYIVNRGQVAFPKEASWLAACLEELGSFPLGKTNDFVDALVHALSYVGRPSEFAPIERDAGVRELDTIQEYKQLGNGLRDLDEEMNNMLEGRPAFDAV